MIIKYVKGDAVQALIDGEVNALFHCCNCQGKMNSGIAKQIRHTFPNVYELYIQESEEDLGLGDVHVINVKDHCKRGEAFVVNLMAQEYYGYDKKRYVNYGALARSVERGIRALYKNVVEEDLPLKLAFPYKIGCDRAGGDWVIVSEMIEYFCKDLIDHGYADVYYYHLEDL